MIKIISRHGRYPYGPAQFLNGLAGAKKKREQENGALHKGKIGKFYHRKGPAPIALPGHVFFEHGSKRIYLTWIRLVLS
jgi:hypothetical protein